MKQYEAVMEVMKNRGGYATLGELYREVFKLDGAKWATSTPFASIRRIVQDKRFFFRIKPGLWALKTHKDEISQMFNLERKAKGLDTEFGHSYYQGLLIEIGNLKNYETFVPNQDKNKKFLDKPLRDLISIDHMYEFSYDHVVGKASTVDVAWFNVRKFPHAFFEVEHSTEFKNSLLKFVELQDFNAEFRIVADKVRERQYRSSLNLNAFKDIAHRVKFLSYDILAELHTKTVELSLIENQL
jgi:hypothetical protein